mgnify:CR=1 FL=1
MSNCKVIALINQKGGVGKSTTTVNLGVGLAEQGKKVLLIDADAQANVTMSLGYTKPETIPITLPNIIEDIIDEKPFDAEQCILHSNEGVDLLPSTIELAGYEAEIINAKNRERVLKTYVNEVKKNYDYVLIDCMPSLGMFPINAMAAADSVIIPTFLFCKRSGAVATLSIKSKTANQPQAKNRRYLDDYGNVTHEQQQGSYSINQKCIRAEN